MTNFNIDIEFTGVACIDLPNTLEGIEITEVLYDIPTKFLHYKEMFGHRIFEIKSVENQHYIIAASYRTGTNTRIAEDCISNMNPEYHEIIATS